MHSVSSYSLLSASGAKSVERRGIVEEFIFPSGAESRIRPVLLHMWGVSVAGDNGDMAVRNN